MISADRFYLSKPHDNLVDRRYLLKPCDNRKQISAAAETPFSGIGAFFQNLKTKFFSSSQSIETKNENKYNTEYTSLGIIEDNGDEKMQASSTLEKAKIFWNDLKRSAKKVDDAFDNFILDIGKFLFSTSVTTAKYMSLR